jgi:hypothetical protein
MIHAGPSSFRSEDIMVLTRQSYLTIISLMLIGTPCAAQDVVLDSRIRDDPAKMQAWYGERGKFWEQWLPLVGKARCGVILELRLVNPRGDGGRATDLIVSARNVSSRPVWLGDAERPVADVLLRDSAGRFTRMTKEGLDYLESQVFLNCGMSDWY